MSTTDPLFIQFWDRLADRIAAVRPTGVAYLNTNGTPTAGITLTMSWKGSLGVPGQVLKGYGQVPPPKGPIVYCLPPRVSSGDGLSMGSFLRRVTYPVLGFVEGIDAPGTNPGGGISSESRIREAGKCMDDIMLSLETDRAQGSPAGGGAFGGLQVFDFTLTSGDADDGALIGAGGFGVFYFEASLSYEIPMQTRGL
jgi:hypothetical protein